MIYLGIDISKATFHAALLQDQENKPQVRVFGNHPAGFSQLAAWLVSLQVQKVHACMEATGSYGDGLALFLHEQRQIVSIVNPAATHHFALSQMSRTKTDLVDARTIAHFCQRNRPPAWTPPPAEVRELQALVRRVDSLMELRTMEANRLEVLRSAGQSGAVTAASVERSVKELVTFLEGEIERLQQQIKEHIEQHSVLQQKRDLLISIPGIGESTAARILSELPDVRQFQSARQVAAFAGLVPKVRESGTSVRGRPRLSKAGSRRLRKALYFPAVTALTHNPLVRALRERLLAKGKSKMLIVGAAMRKLLVLAYGVLKSGRPFDPSREGTPAGTVGAL